MLFGLDVPRLATAAAAAAGRRGQRLTTERPLSRGELVERPFPPSPRGVAVRAAAPGFVAGGRCGGGGSGGQVAGYQALAVAATAAVAVVERSPAGDLRQSGRSQDLERARGGDADVVVVAIAM